jgi:hypothetical protein
VGVATLTLSGFALERAGVRWSSAFAAATILVLWLGAALVGVAVRGRARREPRPPAGAATWAVAGTLVAAVLGALPMIALTGRPDALPQAPDTIFHLGTIMTMVATGDASTLHATAYTAGPGAASYYPAAFHVVATTVVMASGTQAVVAASAVALVTAVLVWPLGVLALAREVLGDHPIVLLTAPVAAVALAPFPTWFMGYGVLWPNLLGQALVAGTLALIVGPVMERRSVVAAVVAVGAVSGVALAHPNALAALLILVGVAALAKASAGVLSARRVRTRLVRAIATLALVGLVVAGWQAATRASPAMQASNPPGPETSWGVAVLDVLFAAARGLDPSWVAGALVLLGSITVLRRGRPWWVAVAWLATSALYVMTAAVDSPDTRVLTWPWYNNAPRLAALVVLPAAVLLVAALLAIDRFVGRALRHASGGGSGRRGAPAATVGVVAVFLVVSGGAHLPARADVLDAAFNPPPEKAWVSERELAALRVIGQDLPVDAVVAANPWRGGQYLYPVSGRRVLFPTEKVRESSPERLRLARSLNDVGTNPKVCAAARKLGVEWALTGGSVVSTGPPGAFTAYRGVDSVGTSYGWERVRIEAPFTLYRRTACADA